MALGKNSPIVGESAPQFCLPDKDGREICLESLKGRWVVLYFYPKDNTSGCTLEAIGFSGMLDELANLDATVIGVSLDSAASHTKFADKHSLKLVLLSDVEHKVLEDYGVWQHKKLYGRDFLGVVRSTFIIDPAGRIAHIWPKVSVKGHVDEVKRKLVELQG